MLLVVKVGLSDCSARFVSSAIGGGLLTLRQTSSLFVVPTHAITLIPSRWFAGESFLFLQEL